MGILSRIGNTIKNVYNRADRAVGGYLPGGATPSQVAASKPSSSSSYSAPASQSTSPGAPSAPSGSSSKSSSGGSSGSSSINLPPSSGLPSGVQYGYQTRGTATDLAPKVPDSVKSVNVQATYGGGSSSSKPASASATGASGSALNQGGGPASPGVSEVTAYQGPNLNKPYDVRDDMTFGQKVQSVVGQYTSVDFYRDVGQRAFGAGDYSSPKPISAFTAFISPFDVFGSTKTRGELKGPDMGGTYTGQYNPATGQYDVPDLYKGKTGYERAREQYLLNPDVVKPAGAIAADTASQVIKELQPGFETRAAEIASGYQSRINAGSLTVEQATPQYNADIAALQSQFSAQAQDIYSQRVGPKIAASQAFSKEFAGYNQALFPKISTVGTGAALIAGGFTGGSSIAAVRAVSGVVNAAVAVEGASNVGEGISNKNYLQAGLGLAAFGLGTYGALRYAANEVTIAQIEGVSQQAPVRVGVYRSQFNQQENMFIDRGVYKQATSSAQAYTRTETISRFNPESRTFDVISGTSETVGRTTDFWTGRQFTFGSYSTFSGAGSVVKEGSLFANAGQAVNFAPEGYTPSITKLKITNQYQYSTFGSFDKAVVRNTGTSSTKFFGSFVGGQEGSLKFISGPIQKGTFTIDTVKGQGFVAYQNFRPGVFNVESYGTINEIKPGSGTIIDFRPFPSSGLRGNLPTETFSGGATLAAQTTSGGNFQIPANLIESFAAPANSLSQASAFAGASQAIASTGRSFAAPAVSLFAGFGQYEKTENIQYGLQIPVIQSASLQKQFQPGLVDQLPGVRSGGSQIPILSPVIGQSPGLGQPQLPVLQQPFGFPGITPGGPNRFNPQFDPDLVFGLPGLKGFDAGDLGLGPIGKGNQRLKYTPDFEALVFGIKGRAPPGGEAPSPFASRPIPRGFSFAFEEGPNFGDLLKNLPGVPGLPRPKRRRR